MSFHTPLVFFRVEQQLLGLPLDGDFVSSEDHKPVSLQSIPQLGFVRCLLVMIFNYAFWRETPRKHIR